MNLYEKVFGKLSDEEMEMLNKADIPIFEEVEEETESLMTEEDKKKAHEDLRRIVREFEGEDIGDYKKDV